MRTDITRRTLWKSEYAKVVALNCGSNTLRSLSFMVLNVRCRILDPFTGRVMIKFANANNRLTAESYCDRNSILLLMTDHTQLNIRNFLSIFTSMY